MKNKKDHRTPFERILDQIEGKEKFHNFDGNDYEDYLNDLGYNEDDEFENMNGQHHKRITYKANPYQIIIENPTDKPLKAVIFGNDRHLLKPNFGSDRGIIIQTSQPNVEYVEILQRSSTHQFKTQHIRIESENVLQLSKPMTIHEKDAAGRWAQNPLNLHIYRSPYQQQEKVIDIDDILIDIDGSTYLEHEIEPKTRVFYSIFPLYEINTAGTLMGQDPIKAFAPAGVNSSLGRRPKRIVPQIIKGLK